MFLGCPAAFDTLKLVTLPLMLFAMHLIIHKATCCWPLLSLSLNAPHRTSSRR